MPLYFFKCPECQKEYEVIQKYEDKCICPDCLCECKRQVTCANFEFKAKGFYHTDYKIHEPKKNKGRKTYV